MKTELSASEKNLLDIENGNLPMEDILCFFHCAEREGIIDGFLCFGKHGHFIQARNSWQRYNPSDYSHYQEVLNPKGGFIFLPNKEVRSGEGIEQLIEKGDKYLEKNGYSLTKYY